jgi:hypothetical protein
LYFFVDIHFSLNGSEIEIVNEFNYLGILLNRTGNFNKAITKQAEKAKQAMYEQFPFFAVFSKNIQLSL